LIIFLTLLIIDDKTPITENRIPKTNQLKLSEIGEFGFIERFAHRFEDLIKPPAMGIGDDCAILPADEFSDFVITTDMLVEDVHFVRSKISPFNLGHKALAVNLSDVAAMGAKPIGSFLSIAIPSNIEVEYLDELMEGYHQLSERYKLPLMGGDTTRSPEKLVINISVIGRIGKNKSRLRSMAASGDIIAVTGFLGDSATGLKIILENHKQSYLTDYFVGCHNRPNAAVDEGQWLAEQPGVHAMMDISDGIASDLNHILKASKKAGVIDIDKLPLSKQLVEYAEIKGLNTTRLATTGGEDYHLLVTIEVSKFEAISSAFMQKFEKPLYAVGRIEEGKPIITYFDKGNLQPEPGSGFNHFV
jgi:thiamine-monophosphate kinase